MNKKYTLEEITQGVLDIEIDELIPCLKCNKTGDFVKTEVFQITNKKILKDYNIKTRWNINWCQIPNEVEVYGITIKGSSEIQGLIGIRNAIESQSVFIHWASTSPNNNKQLRNGKQDYLGVGGHLFAIAIEKSCEYGYNGNIYGYAINLNRLEHFINVFGAIHAPFLHQFQFIIDEIESKKIQEVYNYEWK